MPRAGAYVPWTSSNCRVLNELDDVRELEWRESTYKKVDVNGALGAVAKSADEFEGSVTHRE